MIRAILDEVVPGDIATLLAGDVLVEPFPDDWRSLSDGAVLRAANVMGYDWLITCDKNMPFQQNLAGSAVCALILPMPRLPEIERIRQSLHKVLRKPVPGHFILLDMDGRRGGDPSPHFESRGRSKR